MYSGADVTVVIAALNEAQTITDVITQLPPVCGRAHRGRRPLARRHCAARRDRRGHRPDRQPEGQRRCPPCGNPAREIDRDRVHRRGRVARSRRHSEARAANRQWRGRSCDRVPIDGRLERTPWRLRRVLPTRWQLLHHGVPELEVRRAVERQSERLQSHSHDRAARARSPRGHDDDRTGNDHRDASPRLSHGGSAKSRVLSPLRTSRTSACGGRRRAMSGASCAARWAAADGRRHRRRRCRTSRPSTHRSGESCPGRPGVGQMAAAGNLVSRRDRRAVRLAVTVPPGRAARTAEEPAILERRGDRLGVCRDVRMGRPSPLASGAAAPSAGTDGAGRVSARVHAGGIRRAANKPDLLRRAHLSAHRPEPERPAARADVQ